MNKKHVAKEWLYFLGISAVWVALLFALETTPTGAYLVKTLTKNWPDSPLGSVLLICLPYLLVLLIRSIVWAFKTARSKE